MQIRAGNARGYGAWSPSATIVVGLPAAPAAPTLTSGVSQATAAWTAPSGNGSAISDYDVRYRVSGASTWTAVTHTGTGLTATITGLTNGTAYEVQVRAGNARGTSPWSPSGTVVSGGPLDLAAPTLSSGNAKLTAAWVSPTGGVTVSDYDVRYRACTDADKTCPDADDTWGAWTDVSHTGTGLTATITGLTNGTAYEVQVRAENAQGVEGAWSATATDKPGRPPAPAAPTLTVQARQLTVNWTAPTANGLAVSDYDVQYCAGTTTHCDAGTASVWTEWNPSDTGTTTSAVITGLTPATAYRVRVRAASSAGDGPWSASAGATTSTAAPEAPAAPTLAPASGSITANWAEPPDNGAAITDYDVRYCAGTATYCDTNDATKWTEWQASTTSTALSTTINTGLTDGTLYQVQVRAENSAGTGAWSPSATMTAGAPAAPAAPTLVASVGKSTGDIAVSWTAPSGNGAAVDDYDVRYRRVGQGSWIRIWDGGSGNSTHRSGSESADNDKNPVDFGDLGVSVISRHEVDGTNNYGLYQVGKAVDEIDIYLQASGFTGKSSLRTSAQKPTGNLYTTGTELASTASGQSLHYRTRIGPIAENGYFWVALEQAATTSVLRWRQVHGVDLADTDTDYSLTGLANDTTYEVQVRAGNSRGDGPWSLTATAAPVAQKPTAPAAPAVTPGNAQLSVAWAAPDSNGSAITDYDVRYCAGTAAYCDTSNASRWTELPDTADSTARSATIPNLINSTTYRVQVRAGNVVGDSAWSAATARAPGVPSAPAAPTVAPSGRTLAVSWTAPSLNGMPITDYDVRYCKGTATHCDTATASRWTEWDPTGTSTTTSATITGLTAATAYSVQVSAASSAGAGPWSAATRTETGPVAPTLTSSSGTLTITWTAPAGIGTITDYRLRFKKKDPDENNVASTWSDWNTYYDASIDHTESSTRSTGGSQPLFLKGTTTVSGVTVTSETFNHNNYKVYKIGSAIGSMRLRVSGRTSGDHRNMHARYHSSRPTATSQGTLLWTAFADPDFSGDGTASALAADSYFWVYGEGALKGVRNIRFQLDMEKQSTATTASVSNVPDGTTYEFAVQAVTSGGAHTWSASAVHLVGSAPSAPNAPTLVSAGTSLLADWAAPSDDGGFAVSDYDVRYCAGTTTYCDTGTASKWTEWNPDSTSTTTSATITGLTNGTVYQVQVRAQNAKGTGAWSARAEETAGAPEAPAAPTIAPGDARLTASWTAPAANGSAITDYDVRYRKGTSGAWTEIADVTDSTAVSATIASLDNDHAYQVQVRAQNARAAGAWSPTAAATPSVLPAAPAAPTLTIGDRQLGVAWTALPRTGSAITDYDVRYCKGTAAHCDPANASRWTEWNASRHFHDHQRDDHGPDQRLRLPGAGAGGQRHRRRPLVGIRGGDPGPAGNPGRADAHRRQRPADGRVDRADDQRLGDHRLQRAVPRRRHLAQLDAHRHGHHHDDHRPRRRHALRGAGERRRGRRRQRLVRRGHRDRRHARPARRPGPHRRQRPDPRELDRARRQRLRHRRLRSAIPPQQREHVDPLLRILRCGQPRRHPHHRQLRPARHGRRLRIERDGDTRAAGPERTDLQDRHRRPRPASARQRQAAQFHPGAHHLAALRPDQAHHRQSDNARHRTVVREPGQRERFVHRRRRDPGIGGEQLLLGGRQQL